MKIIYTILFFGDTLILFILARIFLKLIDAGMDKSTFALLLSGIILSIVLLVLFMLSYIKLPTRNSNNDLT